LSYGAAGAGISRRALSGQAESGERCASRASVCPGAAPVDGEVFRVAARPDVGLARLGFEDRRLDPVFARIGQRRVLAGKA